MIFEPCRKTVYGAALIVAILIGVTCSEAAHAQSTDKVEGNYRGVVGNVFGFCLGQHYALEQVGQLYPDLAAEAARAEVLFDMTTSKVCEKAKDFLVRQYSAAEVDDFTRQKLVEIKPLIDVSDRSVAEGFLAEVRGRAHWQIAQPFLSNILAVRYRESAIGEVADGHVRKVESDSDPKLIGTKFSLNVPISWSEKAGERPHIWKTWTSGNGTGAMMIQLIMRDLGHPLTVADFAEMQTMSPSDIVPETDQVLGGGPFVLEGLSGMMARYKAVRQRLDFKIAQIGELWMLPLPAGAVVMINCLAGAEDGHDAILQERYEDLVPVCQSVVNSLVVQSLY